MISTYQRLKRQRAAEGSSSGFTLIELLIVIVVLGILAAVVIFALGGITGKSAKAACQADGATVSTAISAFNAQNPGITVSVAQLLPSGATATNGGPYMQSWPKNLPHYEFIISGGKLYVQTTPAGAVTGPPTPGPTTKYNGPGTCSAVQ